MKSRFSKSRQAIYALYKGDEPIDDGTLKEMSERQGVKVETLRFISTPAYIKRMEEKNYKNYKVVFRLDDDDE